MRKLIAAFFQGKITGGPWVRVKQRRNNFHGPRFVFSLGLIIADSGMKICFLQNSTAGDSPN